MKGKLVDFCGYFYDFYFSLNHWFEVLILFSQFIVLFREKKLSSKQLSFKHFFLKIIFCSEANLRLWEYLIADNIYLVKIVLGTIILLFVLFFIDHLSNNHHTLRFHFSKQKELIFFFKYLVFKIFFIYWYLYIYHLLN